MKIHKLSGINLKSAKKMTDKYIAKYLKAKLELNIKKDSFTKINK